MAQCIVVVALFASAVWFIVEEQTITFKPVLCLLVGFIVFDAWRYGRTKAIECYENGVSLKHWRKVKNIRYQDIVAARYKAAHEYLNGIYIVTKVKFEIMTTNKSMKSIDIGCNKIEAENIWSMVELILRKNPKVRLKMK